MTKSIRGEQPWYAVRCIFRMFSNQPWGPTNLRDGESAYEERITLWRATSFEDAVAKAETEALDYVDGLDGTEYLGLAQGFQVFCDPGEGAEVFSLTRRSSLPPDEYLDRFFDTGEEYQRSTD